MKKRWLYIGLIMMTLTACNKNGGSSTVKKNEDLIDAYWNDTYLDYVNGFEKIEDIKNMKTYVDNQSITQPVETFEGKDVKHVFFNKNNYARVASLADGYTFTIPAKTMEIDASLSKLRTKYITDKSVLTISFENQNPYGDTEHGWEIYFNEWLQRFINNPEFLAANNLNYIEQPKTIANFLGLYAYYSWDIEILDNENIEYPYYSIRVLREKDSFVNFYLFVLKSKVRNVSQMETVVNSFFEYPKIGELKNVQQEYELKLPSNWNEETKAYYNKLQNQNRVDWGAFSVSMSKDKSSDYNTTANRLLAEKERIETAWDYSYDILPTYKHIGWGTALDYFPNNMAKALASGNGFNGKPVLQFTYQFTTHNNTELEGYTPMFDILRGTYDTHFKILAQNVRDYRKPVLFRLNNEMNTDWTSYAGIISLLDPDIFILTWKKLYKIFEDEGVNNAIWIFNPIARSTPHSNWGDALNYMPGSDYVQMLGLTSYEMGNDAEDFRSFEQHYTELYQRNTPYFNQFPAIISEFAAGAGGEVRQNYEDGTYYETELGRNQDIQAKWVEEMFKFFNAADKDQYPFVKNIKAAIWFSTNDYVTVNGQNKIINYLKLDDQLVGTLNAFKEGLKNNK